MHIDPHVHASDTDRTCLISPRQREFQRSCDTPAAECGVSGYGALSLDPEPRTGAHPRGVIFGFAPRDLSVGPGGKPPLARAAPRPRKRAAIASRVWVPRGP